MGTFLTTSKMSPALRARIEASVRGPRRRQGASIEPRLTSLFRLGAAAVIVGLVVTLVQGRRRAVDALAESRRALLASVHAEAAHLGPDDTAFVSRAESWLLRSSGPYEGDLVANELKGAAFSAALTGPALYVRGPIASFKSSAGVAPAAILSFKEAFLLCLLEPPSSRAEKAVLGKVHAAYSGAANVEARTSNVRRLGDAEVGLPFLLPAWSARVESAKDPYELGELKQYFDRAPIRAAIAAVKSRLLIFVMDEPGESSGLSELDGERPHGVRIGIVDLVSSKALLRLEKRVDPSWISLPSRPQYAMGLDSCALALEVRDAVTAPLP